MLAYLINQYPRPSHSFIRREIQELERQGWQVQRIALRGRDAALPDAGDQGERARTRYVLDGPAMRIGASLGLAVLRQLARHPRRFLRALALTLRCGRRAHRPWPYHLLYLAEACKVAQLLRLGGVRHLHAHFGTNAAQVAMLAALLAGIGYSFTVHGPEEFDHAQSLHLHEKARHAAFVVAVSTFGRSQLYRWLPHADWDKVHVIRCGLDATYGAAAAAPRATPRIVCVGRLCEQKGQLLLLDAVARLRAAGNEVHLVLAGDGELREALAQLGAPDAVTITGWLSGAQIRQQLLAARAMVLPSFAEGLPVALMEAMALGRPVLSTYVAGIPELVKPGRNGWLVPAGDLEALTSALAELLATPQEELARMGANGRQDVEQQHSLAHQAAELGHLFRRALQTAEARS